MKYQELCVTLQAIENTSKRKEKTTHIATLLKKANNDLERVLVLLQGKIFPAWDKRTMGVSSKLMVKALGRVTGTTTKNLEEEWMKKGDLGLVAEKHVTGKTQTTLFTEELTVKHVLEQLQKLTSIEGKGSVDTKMKIISELLSKSTPVEARYVTRTILEVLRVGIATGTIRDAITKAFLSEQAGIKEGEIEEREKYNSTTATVQAAYDKTNDFTIVAQAAKKGIKELQKIRITLGTPLKVMLGLKGTTVSETMKTLGTPILLQYKYDGFRMEIHKEGNKVHIFTRRLEEVTKQFPEVAERVRKHVKAKNCILDGEAIGIHPETKKYRPFQEISQRIRRKYSIQEMTETLPVDVRIFDIMLLEGEELIQKPLRERQKIIEEIVGQQELLGVAHTIITSNEEEGQKFYEQALKEGEEGIFAKKIDSPYQPGSRVGNWIKLKNTMEPVDVVVLGGEWGEGKRSGWITSFLLAIQDEEGNLLTIGKVGTGLKELEEEGFSFKELTELLKPLITYEKGRTVHVKPEIILEVAYNEIQKSPSYESGFALRFPRILRNRTDERSVDDVTPLRYVEDLYEQQTTS